MALFRKFFLRKTPDRLLEISERFYVFDSCFSTDVLEDDEYRHYIDGIATQLRDYFPDASFMVFNFHDGQEQSHQNRLSGMLSSYDMTVMDYPRQYQGCPLLTMEMISHVLRSGENWLSLEGQQNMLLMHCEQGGWPVLAFMAAALLLYRKTYVGEDKTLDMVYKQATRELMRLPLSPLNSIPSQRRYLRYISHRNVSSEWPPVDGLVNLDSVILRSISGCNGENGCRLLFRIHGKDPLLVRNNTPKVFFSTPKQYYKQADCELIKINIDCHIQGDVVLECISVGADQVREEMMFRVMFSTAFIRSNILVLNRDEIDMMWDAKYRFPEEFRAEVIVSAVDSANQSDPTKVADLSPLLHPSRPPPPPPSAPRFSPAISSAQPSLLPAPTAPAAGDSSRDNTISGNLQTATSLTIQLLQELTEYFSDERKIGQGAFGRVYMGILENEKKIAVKVLYNNNPGLDDELFQREFGNLMMLKHQNIVQLVGYCYETQHEPMQYKGRTIFAEKTYRALCFEYMQNGSLTKFLSDECDLLTWHTCYKIIRGTCEGLKYLHEGFKEPIYHLDLKPDNILLDENMVPKLADFGLSRLIGDELTRITQSPIGTIGYLPKEYIDGQIVSNKLDIFSLGVVMIMIIAGPRGRYRSADMPRQKFLDLVHANWRNRLQKTFSSRLVEAYCQQVKICTEIALSCMEIDRHKRPCIADIICQLNDTADVLDEGPSC